jgi:hypothetical protein
MTADFDRVQREPVGMVTNECNHRFSSPEDLASSEEPSSGRSPRITR